MNTIVVATDFSERSDRALRRAPLLAGDACGSMVISNAVDDDKPRRLVKEERGSAEAFLRDLCATLINVDGVRCEAEVVVEEPSRALAKAVKKQKPDLLVLGPHRRQIFRDVFAGATAERTIRIVPCPVLMTNSTAIGPYRHALITTDFSEGEEESRVAFEKLTAIMASIENSGFDPVLRQALTSTKDQILTVATQLPADVIVIATHGERTLSRILRGSVIEAVLRVAPVDVLATPARPAA